MTKIGLSDDDVATVTRTARTLYDYSEHRELLGACHHLSALGYLLLREQEIVADLCIGVVHTEQTPFQGGLPVNGIDFDHSWLEVAGLPVDVAIARPLPPGVQLAPVLFGHHLDDGREAEVIYGVDGILDEEASRVARCSFAEFMDEFPSAGGLWPYATALGGELGLELDASVLRLRHGAVRWSRRPATLRLSMTRSVRRLGARIGRNDACPCGSGKKYKKCCSP
jgi:hypothetical protein